MPKPAREGWYKPSYVAKLLDDLSVRRLQQLAKDGIVPKAEDGMYNAAGCVKGYIRFLKYGKNEKERSEIVQTDHELKKQNLRAKNFENDVREGKFLPRDDVQLVFNEMAATIVQNLAGIPNRLAGPLSTISQPAIIREKIKIELNVARESIADKLHSLSGITPGVGRNKAATPKRNRTVGRPKANTSKRKSRARKVQK